jgi:hypothetical protein
MTYLPFFKKIFNPKIATDFDTPRGVRNCCIYVGSNSMGNIGVVFIVPLFLVGGVLLA